MQRSKNLRINRFIVAEFRKILSNAKPDIELVEIEAFAYCLLKIFHERRFYRRASHIKTLQIVLSSLT